MSDLRLDACTDALDKLADRMGAFERDCRDDGYDLKSAPKGPIAKPVDQRSMEGLLAAYKAGKISAKELGDALMALGQLANRDDAETRADPPVSEKQRRAMYAAASGKSTLGIPKKVGKEFTEVDPGGKLPEHKDDSSTNEARIAGTKAGREGKTPRDNPYKSSDPDYDVWESYRLSGTKQRAYKELGLPIRAA